LLTTDNVIDVLQLARLRDAPRLNLLCTRLIVESFKTVAKSEGWKAGHLGKPTNLLLHAVQRFLSVGC